MDKLIEALGINPGLLLAQLVNFVVLLLILKKFAFKPILTFVQERTKKIEEGLRNAENATEALAKAQQDQDAIIQEARAEGRSIVAEARAHAEKQAQELLAKNAEQIAALNAKHEADMKALHAQMMKEVRAEASSLVFAVTEKVLREKLNDATDKKMVETYLAEQK